MRALASVASVSVLALVASGCVRPIEARGDMWWRARTARIVVEGDGGEERTRQAAVQLEHLENAVSLAFYHCGPRPDHVIQVTLLTNDVEYDALVRDGIGGVALRPIDDVVVLPPRIVMNAESIEDSRTAASFAHELTHLFVQECFPSAPSWLHEGLASVFETVYLEDDQVIAGSPAYRFTESAYFAAVEEGHSYIRLVPLRLYVRPSDLVRMPSDDFYSRDGEGREEGLVHGHYASAWNLVHMLALGTDAALRRRFVTYLDALSAGAERSDSAFDLAFYGVDLDAAAERYSHEQRLSRIARRWTGEVAEVTTEPMPPAEAHLRLAEIGWRVGREESVVVAEEHATVALRDPGVASRVRLLRAALTEDSEALAALRSALAVAETTGLPSLDELRASVVLSSDTADSAPMRARILRLTTHPDRRASDLALAAIMQLELPPSPEHIERARALIEEALGLDRRSAVVWLAKGRLELASGDRDEARRSLRTAENLAGHGSSVASAARQWLRRG